jgi:hypothetical protein
MHRKLIVRSAQGASLALITAAGVWAAENLPQAPPPKFDDAVVNEVFVKDARQQLTGTRPDYDNMKKAAPTGTTKPPGPGDAPMPPAGGSADGNSWSALVSAETLESEVKAQPKAIDAAMKATDPRKSTRMVMTNVSAVFGVIQKYDKDVRWKTEAQAMRDEFAKASVNLKAFTDSQKRQVAKVQTDLNDLIQGNAPAVSPSLEPDAPWNEVADLVPVMHRFEVGQQERLAGMTKDADAVKRNADAVVREAEIMAMLARIIQDKSYENGEDDTYLGFARELEKQAVEAVAATKRGDGAAASSAVSKMQKACDDCHGGFR